jgi:hypothetical protein
MVWVLTPLIYLNIAGLHHRPSQPIALRIGKSIFNKELGDNE